MFSSMDISRDERQQSQEGFPPRPFVTDSTARSMSIDSRDDCSSKIEQPKFGQTMPSPCIHAATIGYQPRLPPVYRKLPSRHLHSVVTNSFSIDEERDDIPRAYTHGRDHVYIQREDKDERHVDREERQAWNTGTPRGFAHFTPTSPAYTRRREYIIAQRTDKGDRRHDAEEPEAWNTASSGGHGYFACTTPSPKNSVLKSRPFLQRAYSSTGYAVPSDAMKRSYYHHSLPTNQNPGHLPPEFMPPSKRTRNEPMKKEIMVSPRDNPQSRNAHMIHRAQSFPIHQSWAAAQYQQGSHHHQCPSPRHPISSPVAFRRNFHGTSCEKYAQVSPASETGESPRSWRSDPAWIPSPYAMHSNSHFWVSPRSTEVDNVLGLTRNKCDQNEAGFPQSIADDKDFKPVVGNTTVQTGDEKMRMMVEAAAAANSVLNECTVSKEAVDSSKSTMLLALPDDRVSLSETLCVVRENIEVFTATQSEVDAPAPGRKHAVVVGQVGLRCIHCRHATRCSDRVKRAVCYPSSIKRIYRTVIDMKLDHFAQCKFVPVNLKNHLDELKAVHTRSTGTTMQYFIQAAHALGMEDGVSGVVLGDLKRKKHNPNLVPSHEQRDVQTPRDSANVAIVTQCDSLSSGSWASGNMDTGTDSRIDCLPSWSFEASPANRRPTCIIDKNFKGLIPLSLVEDKTALSPLRCFLREQVCAFSATETDIAVRAPTTFSIAVGQVGIGCIHCVKQAAMNRSNRAVCFPFSIGRIYQSVADIQRFHFGECKMMPNEIKERFLELQSASSKGSKGLATRQYWVTSAKKIGLVDTPQGIRFGRDPSKPESTASFSLDILAQVAVSVTTASKPLVLPDDKPCIAEFLYVVMEQLQPCRFTEADRNKRRLKDVGCIGVECKHCAGQVDSRKFFWSSVSAVESNFVSVHTHVLECKSVPQRLKDRLVELKKLRKEQTAALRTGSQKSFFARVWRRLHSAESA